MLYKKGSFKMNEVFLIGRLTKDPELKFTPNSGAAVSHITLAVDRYNSTTKEKEADFIPVVIWGKQAESLANYMVKGSQIAVTGRIHTRTYETKDEGKTVFVVEVIATKIQFLNSNNKKENPVEIQGEA